MSPAEIIDLDALVPPDKHVKVNGKTYTLPGDLPVEMYLRIQQASKNLATETDQSIEEIRKSIIALFQVRDPKVTAEDLAGMGIEMQTTLLTRVYTTESADPKPPRTRGGTSRKTRNSSGS